MNIPVVIYIAARVLEVEGVFMMLPFAVGMIYKESSAYAYLIVGVIEFMIGFLISRKKPGNSNFYAKEGFVAVSLCWIIMGVIGALPFVLSGDIPEFYNAFFETVSGFTTTGASILTNVEGLTHASLMWRCFTHWLGGMGVLVFVLSILPLGGAKNIYLMRAESPGPSVGKLVPKVRSTAANLYRIYFFMTILEVIFLLAGGMDVFSSFALSFATAGTGGFGLLNDSCAGYSSYVQIVITVFMILFGVNFSVYYLLLTRKFRQALSCEEIRWYFGIIFISIALITINVLHLFDYHVADALKNVAFTVGSIITTTGFATSDFNEWPAFSQTILVGLMFIGACAGSTGGGLKVSRIVIYLKTVGKAIEQYIHPRSIKIVKFEGKQVEHEVIRGVNTFLITYIILYVLSMLVISLDNFSFTTNFTAVAAAINNIGPGLDMVGPTGNFSQFSVLSKMILVFDMLAGRLEIFPILLLFVKSTYKK